jgi:hypothetical protein
MLGRNIIGGACLISILLTTQVAAQMQPGAPPRALPQKPRPPAPPPAASPFCMFESKEYSIGAVLCLSSQMAQVCTAPDTEHSHSWWSSGPQPLCSAVPSTGAPPLTHAPAGATQESARPSILPEAVPKSVEPPFPAEPSIPKTKP